MSKIIFDENKCKGCALCTVVCPKGLVSLADNKLNIKGFNPAQVINKDACTGCGLCATICPDIVITIEK